jgi:putative Holliday junction resolvase
MPVVDFLELRTLLVRDGRLMALDVGSKTIGIATSDALRMLATPLMTIKRGKLAADLAALADLAKKHDIKALAIGLPLNMDGTEGPRAKLVRDFAARLTARLKPPRPIHFQDERLTSADADWQLARSGKTHKEKKQLRDALAAATVLRDFLERDEGGETVRR